MRLQRQSDGTINQMIEALNGARRCERDKVVKQFVGV